MSLYQQTPQNYDPILLNLFLQQQQQNTQQQQTSEADLSPTKDDSGINLTHNSTPNNSP